MIQGPLGNEFPIGRFSGCCAGCGARFQPGQVYYAVIWREGDQYLRKDYDEICWKDVPADAVGAWRAKVPVPEVKARTRHVPVKLLMSVFDRLGEAEGDGEVTQKLRFVLALLLMRRRMLRLITSRQEDQCQVWRMKRAGEDAEVDVVCPVLSSEDTDALSQQLADLLAGLDQEAESLG